MIITFDNKKVANICNDYRKALKEVGKQAAEELVNLMGYLRHVPHIAMFRQLPTLKRYKMHELKGREKGIVSLSITYAYRVTLTVEIKIEEDEVNILEVSNHYGD